MGIYAVLALVLASCGGRTALPIEDLDHAPTHEEYFVTTTSGEELDFVTLKVGDGQLQGTVRTVQKRVTGQGDEERMEVRNQYREVSYPLTDIRSVEVRKAGPDRSLVLAAAGAVVAVGVYAILNSSNDNGNGGGSGTGGGKGPPGSGRPR